MPFDLGKEYGPLPLGAWIAVVGGGLGIAIWSRSHQSTGGVQVVEDTRKMEGVGDGFSAYTNASPTVVNPPAEPTTNEEWARKAINYLIAEGYDANVADSAIRKYLESTQLNAQEYALVRYALIKLGAPPVPLPTPPEPPAAPVKPVVVTPTPAPAPAPAPPPAPPMRIVIVTPWPSRRSTLWGIAAEFYGDGNQYRRIWDANRKGVIRPDGSPGFISHPKGWVYPGDRIYVPY